VTCSPKSQFLGDPFAQKSIFGLPFRSKVDFSVTLSLKSRFFGDTFAQKSIFGEKKGPCGRSTRERGILNSKKSILGEKQKLWA